MLARAERFFPRPLLRALSVPGAVGLVAACGGLLVAAPALARQSVLPAIADSPTAQSLFEDALAQAKGNPVEAARLARRLLDEYGDRVLRIGEEQDGMFRSVGDETERFLAANPDVLARFRESESRAAETMLATEGAAATAARRRLTRAGLKATLEVAEELLLADRAPEALAEVERIRSHPDLAGAEAVAEAWIAASAATRIGRDDVRALAVARLEALVAQGEAGADAALASAGGVARGPASSAARSPLEPAASSQLPAADWQQVWSLELDRTLFRRLFDPSMMRANPRAEEAARLEGTYLVTVPVVQGGVAYVNEGSYVRAVDIDSRDEVWARALGFGGIERDGGMVADIGGLAVDRGALVTYEGNATSSRRAASSRVWCLEPAHGGIRWTVDLDGIDGREELAGLFPVGTPLLRGDTVVVLARKPTQRLEQVDWLIGLDREDGGLRWATTLAGASSARGVFGRRQAGMTVDGDAVVVTSPLGVIARVRVDDGTMQWLRRSPVPLAEARSTPQAWEYGGPVVSGDRVVTLSPDEREILALDRTTGKLLEARPVGPGTAWGATRYLIGSTFADGTPVVLGVGGDIVAFDARDLAKRRWMLSETLARIDPPRAGMGNRLGIRGRVSLAGDRLLVSGVEDYLVLSAMDGAVQARISGQTPANAVMLEDRIVAVGDDALRVLMPAGRAEEILRARLVASPNDPAAAAALVDLAIRTGRWEVALEAARVARDGLLRANGSASLRQELIEKAILIARSHPSSGEAAFELAQSLADTPDFRVRVALARGEYLRSEGQAARAAEIWLQIASDPELRDTMIAEEGAQRSVRLDAIRRLGTLASRDVELAAALEQSALTALEALRMKVAAEAQPESDRRVALVRFTMSHPRTAAAVDAVIDAARLGGDRAAMTALSAVLEECLIPPARADLVERCRKALDERLAGTQFADASPKIDRRIAELLVASGTSEAALVETSAALPAIGPEPGAGIELRGQIPVIDGDALLDRDHSILLGLMEGSLVRFDQANLSTRWRLRLDDRDPRIVWCDGRIAVFQRPFAGAEAVTLIDPEQGTVVWSTPRTSAIWTEEPPPVDQQDRLPNGMPMLASEVLVGCDGASVVLVRRDGRLARFGMADPAPDVRIARSKLARVQTFKLHGGLIVLVGRLGGSELPDTVVTVHDPRTLEQIAEFKTISSAPVRWAFATALGEVFLGTDAAIERWAIDAEGTPRAVLVTTNSQTGATSSPMLVGANLLFATANDIPAVLPLFGGETRILDIPDAEDVNRSLRGMVPVPEGVIVHFTDRLLLVGPTGEVRGADVAPRTRNSNFALPVTSGILRCESAVLAGVPDEPGARGVDFGVVVQALSPRHGLRVDGEPFAFRTGVESIGRAVAADGWLLFSAKSRIIGIPMPLGGVPKVDQAVPAGGGTGVDTGG
ncbi:MAG: PQQ-binding-like beta-propeller repeat protein [Planctomycetaceae bacterium]|nr:PQQ-binding-like beta-propeller repeat protein [Planctomycetaceae bacterium]